MSRTAQVTVTNHRHMANKLMISINARNCSLSTLLLGRSSADSSDAGEELACLFGSSVPII